MNVLHLTLKKQWFDMIASGQKREEYREIKPHWNRILNMKQYEAIRFRNGYRPDSPTMLIRLNTIMTGLGIVEWGAPPAQRVYILSLGEILEQA